MDLNWNEITTIEEGAFAGLVHMTHLYLYGNSLASVNAQMWIGLESLRALNIGRNYFTVLEQDALISLPRPLRLVLNDPHDPDDMPWDCPHLCWLKNKVLVRQITWCRDNGSVYLPECFGEDNWNYECDKEGMLQLKTCFVFFLSKHQNNLVMGQDASSSQQLLV